MKEKKTTKPEKKKEKSEKKKNYCLSYISDNNTRGGKRDILLPFTKGSLITRDFNKTTSNFLDESVEFTTPHATGLIRFGILMLSAQVKVSIHFFFPLPFSRCDSFYLNSFRL